MRSFAGKIIYTEKDAVKSGDAGRNLISKVEGCPGR